MTEIPNFKLDDIDPAVEPPKSAEDWENWNKAEAKRQEELKTAKPSEEASVVEQNQNKKEFRKKNNELVLEWLIGQGGIKTGDAFLGKFKKVLEEDHEQDTEGIDQAAELLSVLPELFGQVDGRIAELAKDETKYKNIGEKRIEIIKGICEPVLDGHLTASDATALVTGIEVISINDPDKQSLFNDVGIKSGYEGVMFFDPRDHKIYIFDETLVDDYVKDGTKMNLKIRHMITHEMSHGIVESSIKYNKTLISKANEIIEKAGEIKDSQSIHIRNTLNGIVIAEADFDKYFADHLASSDAYKTIPDTQKEQFKEVEKKKFITDRKIQAAAEILTDYTAIYLQSDGSLEDFALTCLKTSDKDVLNNFLGPEFNKNNLAQINVMKDSTKKAALMAKIGSKCPELIGIYRTFHAEIQKEIINSKGRFAELSSKEGEEEDPFGEYSGAGFMDGPAGFGQQETSGNRTGGGGGESLWSEFGALIKAMSEEAPNVQ